LNITFRGKSQQVDLKETDTVNELKRQVHQKFRIEKNRQGLKAGTKSLVYGDKTLAFYSVTDGATVEVKDFGPQIGYRTVFVVEFLGPILIMLFFASRPGFIYGKADRAFTQVQTIGIACWLAHFLKREFETFFVHKFSRPTMPFFNIVKNSAYYWSFAFLCSYFLCHPQYTDPVCKCCSCIGLGIFVLSEIGNLICHIKLSKLRPAEGSSQRPIPKGFLFNFVSCPNYTFEVLAWVGFSFYTSMLYSWMFTIVGLLQMSEWAFKKHREYIKDYPEYRGLKRKAIIPFVF